MAAFSNLDGATSDAEPKCSGGKDKVPGNFHDSDIHSRFGINVGFGEFLQNWGFWNLSPFRRKSSKPTTPSPLNQSPQKQNNPLSKISPHGEHIELVQFSYVKKLEEEQGIENMADYCSETQETNISSTANIWTDQEVEGVESAIGHEFSPSNCCYPTWCDKCGDLLWGIYETGYYRCRYCHYTCHPHCRSLVTLDCHGEQARDDGDDEHVGLTEIIDPSLEPLLQEASSEEMAGTSFKVGREQLQYLIEEYNSGNTSGLDMTLEEDGSTFRGFIRVHMNLFRPISVVAGTRPPSIYDILKDDETLDKTLTSFYLPRDTVKALHVTSETTTHEVIRALLKKFKVVDNPQKFALYERYYEQGQTAKVKMRRIAENEKPLVLALRWSREKIYNKMFVLQENETGDILWEAFTLPELNNFLRILDREEEEYKKAVRKKYQVMGRKIQEAMARFKPVQEQTINDEGNPGRCEGS